MPDGITVSTHVSPEFDERLENMSEERGDSSKSETLRHLIRVGMQQVEDRDTFAQRLFKHAAIGFAMVALVGYLWAALIADYSQPLYFGVVWMVPAVAMLWLHELWPGIRNRFGDSSTESVNPSEA